MSQTNYKCLRCKKVGLSYEFKNNTYKCLKCGAVFSSEEILNKAKMSKSHFKLEDEMSKKGKCVACKREDVAIVGHGFCSACYGFAKSVDFNVGRVEEYRIDNPVGTKVGRKSKKKMPAKMKKSDNIGSDKKVDIASMLNRYLDNRDSYSEIEREVILKGLSILMS